MKKVRESNIELLRVVAMFLVMIVHAGFFSLGIPSREDFVVNTADVSFKVIMQAISITCVNIFVLISGWFGIRASVKGCCKFLFQCFFLQLLAYGVVLLLGLNTFSRHNVTELFFVTKGLWFVKAYLLLYILSPVLNAFIETVSRQTFKGVLLAYLAFTVVYGWLFPLSTDYMLEGFSPVFFIGLYLLARYIKIYNPKFSKKPIKYDLLVILGMVIWNSFIYLYTLNRGGISAIVGYRFLQPYLSPTVILISLFMLLAFSKIRIKSKLVNWLGASSFAVYLLHCSPFLILYYLNMCKYVHENTNAYTYWISILSICTAIYLLCIIVDQIRIFVWNRLSHLHQCRQGTQLNK